MIDTSHRFIFWSGCYVLLHLKNCTEKRMEIGDFALQYADIASCRFQDSRVT